MDNYIESRLFVRQFKHSDIGSIKRISRDLHPDWFTEEALVNIPRDIQFAKCFVAERDGVVVGFISVFSKDGIPEIGWIGVETKFRGEGIGKLLLKKVEDELGRFGYKELRVKTVGECVPEYEPYAETFRFYTSSGFEVLKKGRLRTDLGFKWRLATLQKKLR